MSKDKQPAVTRKDPSTLTALERKALEKAPGLSATAFAGTGGGGHKLLRYPMGAKQAPIRDGHKRAAVARLLATTEGGTLEEILATATAIDPSRPWDEGTALEGTRLLAKKVGYGLWQNEAGGPIWLLYPERPTVAGMPEHKGSERKAS